MPNNNKRDNVIQDVCKAVDEGQLVPSTHAQQQMSARDIQMSDLEEAIYSAQREEAKDSFDENHKNWKYALRGTNQNGDKDIRIVVVFDDPKVVIITAIDKNKKEDKK